MNCHRPSIQSPSKPFGQWSAVFPHRSGGGPLNHDSDFDAAWFSVIAAPGNKTTNAQTTPTKRDVRQLTSRNAALAWSKVITRIDVLFSHVNTYSTRHAKQVEQVTSSQFQQVLPELMSRGRVRPLEHPKTAARTMLHCPWSRRLTKKQWSLNKSSLSFPALRSWPTIDSTKESHRRDRCKCLLPVVRSMTATKHELSWRDQSHSVPNYAQPNDVCRALASRPKSCRQKPRRSAPRIHRAILHHPTQLLRFTYQESTQTLDLNSPHHVNIRTSLSGSSCL